MIRQVTNITMNICRYKYWEHGFIQWKQLTSGETFATMHLLNIRNDVSLDETIQIPIY